MKLYLFCLESMFNYEYTFKSCECDVEEKPKIYVISNKKERLAPLYVKQFRKDEIGTVRKTFRSYIVVLLENDIEKAKQLIRDYIKDIEISNFRKSITEYEKDIDSLEMVCKQLEV